MARRRRCKLNTGFIGAGKVGCSLGKYFSEKAPGLQVKGYYDFHRNSSQDAAKFVHVKSYETLKDLIGECDMIFLTVPDGSIKDVWKEVSRHDVNGKLICHCSGSMSASDAFEGLKETGALGYSIHPLFAVSDKYHAYKELPGVFFTLEGSDPCLSMIREMLEQMGNPVRIIAPDKKTTYHCGAATASNLVCGLIDLSIELLKDCGFEEPDAIKALAPILTGNMQHIASNGPAASLTGPIERNDVNTVREHLGCLKDDDARQLYRLLSMRLVDMAQQRHEDRDYSDMRQLLRKDETK
ncbi:MAG: DUF2520 domain-containing protein [Bacillota bacterium]|nr:DUF2520 domain-containing protein [Bacillota bacterium]